MKTIEKGMEYTFHGFTHKELADRYSYDPDTGEIRNQLDYVLKAKDQNGYSKVAVKNDEGKYIGMYGHRLAWFLHHGYIHPKLTIDHKDGNTGNNKIDNLRLVPHRTNTKNRRIGSNNTSGQIGVCKIENGTYKVHIGGNYYGVYTKLEDACLVAQEMYRELGFGPNHGAV